MFEPKKRKVDKKEFPLLSTIQKHLSAASSSLSPPPSQDPALAETVRLFQTTMPAFPAARVRAMFAKAVAAGTKDPEALLLFEAMLPSLFPDRDKLIRLVFGDTQKDWKKGPYKRLLSTYHSDEMHHQVLYALAKRSERLPHALLPGPKAVDLPPDMPLPVTSARPVAMDSPEALILFLYGSLFQCLCETALQVLAQGEIRPRMNGFTDNLRAWQELARVSNDGKKIKGSLVVASDAQTGLIHLLPASDPTQLIKRAVMLPHVLGIRQESKRRMVSFPEKDGGFTASFRPKEGALCVIGWKAKSFRTQWLLAQDQKVWRATGPDSHWHCVLDIRQVWGKLSKEEDRFFILEDELAKRAWFVIREIKTPCLFVSEI